MSGNASTPQLTVPQIIDLVQTLSTVRYLAVAGLTVLSWDAILLLNAESVLIWKFAPRLLKIAYGVNKYGVLIMFTAILIGINAPVSLSDSKCGDIFVFATVMSCIIDVVGNALTVFRVFALWGQNKKVFYQLVVGGVIAWIINVVFMSQYLRQTKSSFTWNESIKSCALLDPSGHLFITITWLAQFLFDVFAVTLLVLNAFDLPRRPGDSVWSILYRDKILILLVTFAMRLVGIGLTAQRSKPLYIVVLVGFVQPLISTANSRLIVELYLQHPRHLLPRSFIWSSDQRVNLYQGDNAVHIHYDSRMQVSE